MNPSTAIPDREVDPSIACPGAKDKDNKRQHRAFGPIDMNAIAERQNVTGGKIDSVLPWSPNSTLKKKPKSLSVEHEKVGKMQLPQRPENGSPDSDPIVSDLKNMAIVDEKNPKGKTVVDWKPIQKELDALFVKQSQERMKGVPMIEMPKILIKNGIKIFDHQQEG